MSIESYLNIETTTRTVGSDLHVVPHAAGIYERFLELPVTIVLLGLWLAGAVFLGLGILTLYQLFWLLLESLAGP